MKKILHAAKHYFIIFFFLFPLTVSARVDFLGSLKKIGGNIYGQDENFTPEPPEVLIANIVRVLISFVGIIFVVLIILGGLQWMTSGGNEERIRHAKTRITNAAIGLGIVITAYIIAYWVTTLLEAATTDVP